MPYRKPGVTVNLRRVRGFASELGAADTVLIVGVADNFPNDVSEAIQLLGADPTTLSRTGIDPDSLVVQDSANDTLVEDTDYEVNQTTDAFGVVTTAIQKVSNAVTAEAVTFTGADQTVALDNQDLFGGTVAVSPAAQDEVQQIVIDATGGQFNISDGTDDDDLSATISAGAFTTALEAFTNIGVGNVVVTGGPGDAGGTTPYVVTFGSALASTDIPELVLDGSSLTGGAGTATIETLVNGDDGSTVYIEGIDFAIDYTNGTITHKSSGSAGTMQVLSVDYEWSTISNGETLTVTYENQPEDLFEVQDWDDLSSAVSFYGDPILAGETTPNSPISLSLEIMSAATVGAQLPRILTLAVDPAGDPVSDSSTVDPSDWLAAMEDKIAAQEDVSHIVMLTADTAVWGLFNQFLVNQEAQGNFSRGFLAPDENIDMLANANGSPIFGFNRDRLQVLDREQIVYRNPIDQELLVLPGWYMLGAYVGVESTLPLATPMTHKSIAGLEPLPNSMRRSENAKNLLAASGVTIIENRGIGLWVRHSKSTALQGPASEEPSITRVFDYMRDDMQRSFEEKYIGTGFFVDEPTSWAIRGDAEARLSHYISQGHISNYDNVEVNVGADPRTFEVYATIDPRYPLNNLDFFLLVNV